MLDRILLVRHGETEWNREGRVQGSTDVPLAESGRQQVRTLASALDRSGVQAIWSSPQARAAETATILSSHLKVPVHHDDGLREIACGAWEGKTYGEVIAEDRARFEAWMADPAARAPGGGESFEDVVGRVRGALHRVQARGDASRVLLVSHAAALRGVLAELLALPVLTTTRFALDAASLSVLQYWPEMRCYRLERWNAKA